MKQGSLIAVNGNLYDYIEYDEKSKLHKVSVVDIDEEGNLIYTHNTWYFSNSELSPRGINLTQKQWIGLTKHFLSQNYDLTDEQIDDAANDIVCRCFVITRVPMVEELPNYIDIYMDR